jgi:hypothetical protein
MDGAYFLHEHLTVIAGCSPPGASTSPRFPSAQSIAIGVPERKVEHKRCQPGTLEHVKARRGEKADPEDSGRLAGRLRVGDVRGSFVPPANVAELRDLTRRRKKLLGAAGSERNRIQKLLERGNVTMGNVFGISGQHILHALLNRAGLTPAELAQLARGTLRNKIGAITERWRDTGSTIICGG